MIGRLRKPASALFLSVLALPVSGSLASLSEMMVPHNAGPHGAMRTVALPSSVCQVPVGSAARLAPSDTPSRAAAIVAVRMNFIGLPLGSCGFGGDGGRGGARDEETYPVSIVGGRPSDAARRCPPRQAGPTRRR